MSLLPVHLRLYTGGAAAPAEVSARADAAQGRRGTYIDAIIGGEDAGSGQQRALLPRYGFTRFALRPDTLFVPIEHDDNDEPPPRAEGRSTYARAADRGRVEIASGDLVDLKV